MSRNRRNGLPSEEELIGYMVREGRIRPIRHFHTPLPSPPPHFEQRPVVRPRKGLLVPMILSFIIPAVLTGLIIWWVCSLHPFAQLIVGIIGAITILSIKEFRSLLREFFEGESGAERVVLAIIMLLSIPFLISFSTWLLPIIVGVEVSSAVVKSILGGR
jgi:hypothetical protein